MAVQTLRVAVKTLVLLTSAAAVNDRDLVVLSSARDASLVG